MQTNAHVCICFHACMLLHMCQYTHERMRARSSPAHTITITPAHTHSHTHTHTHTHLTCVCCDAGFCPSTTTTCHPSGPTSSRPPALSLSTEAQAQQGYAGRPGALGLIPHAQPRCPARDLVRARLSVGPLHSTGAPTGAPSCCKRRRVASAAAPGCCMREVGHGSLAATSKRQ